MTLESDVPEGLSRFKHIAVEGVIGVGKTTLARRLASDLGATLLLERPEDNPFLEKFYADPSRYALPTQLSFLFQRVEQASGMSQRAIFAPTVVSDFMFAKDELFARLTLSDDEYRLYRRIADELSPTVPRPDVVIWLRAGAQVLLERIAKRGRVMERGLDAATLQSLDAHYAHYFERDQTLPVLLIDTERMDLVHGDQALVAVVEQLKGFVGPRERLQGLH